MLAHEPRIRLTPSPHELSAYAARRYLLLPALLSPAEAREREHDFGAWVNRYRLGGHIVPHTDRGRSDVPPVATLNVCLAGPPAGNGGELVLAMDGGDVGLHLRAGDAVVFDGAGIEHWTTELVATDQEPEPFRMVAVARYSVSTV